MERAPPRERAPPKERFAMPMWLTGAPDPSDLPMPSFWTAVQLYTTKPEDRTAGPPTPAADIASKLSKPPKFSVTS